MNMRGKVDKLTRRFFAWLTGQAPEQNRPDAAPVAPVKGKGSPARVTANYRQMVRRRVYLPTISADGRIATQADGTRYYMHPAGWRKVTP